MNYQKLYQPYFKVFNLFGKKKIINAYYDYKDKLGNQR